MKNATRYFINLVAASRDCKCDDRRPRFERRKRHVRRIQRAHQQHLRAADQPTEWQQQ